jgi:hypothetical protein
VSIARRRFLQVLTLLAWAAQAPAGDLLAGFSGQDATTALRDGLEAGTRKAIAQLGRENGFFGDARVRIGLPKNFRRAESFLRGLGYGSKVDDLVLAMNRAAEQATPQAQTLLVDAIRQMRVDDAKAVLTGGDQAMTDYFRRTTETRLAEALMPAIQSVTDASDLSRAYRNLAGTLTRFGVDSDQYTVENYVTRKALEGIYFRIGEEERSLRANPAGYAGSLIGRIFGNLRGSPP